MSDSYWVLPDGNNENFPLVLMKRQADALTDQTSGYLRGRIGTINIGDTLHISFQIQVPALGSYMTEIMTYEQPIQIYPGRMKFAFDNEFVEIHSYDQFARALKDYLSSTKMRRLLEALMAQAKA